MTTIFRIFPAPWFGLLVFVNVSPIKPLARGRKANPVTGRFQCVKQVIREGECLIQASKRCNYINEQAFIWPE